MNAVLFDVALTAYILAAAAALASLVWRRDDLSRVARLLTQAGWVCHTAASVLRGVELGRAPVLTLAEVVSVVIWLAVFLDLWVERRYGITTFGAFVLPVVLALGLGLPTGLRDLAFEPQVSSAWILVHVALVLVGLAAVVLNFGSALMYVLQERQLKAGGRVPCTTACRRSRRSTPFTAGGKPVGPSSPTPRPRFPPPPWRICWGP